jgi:hypothetical protein
MQIDRKNKIWSGGSGARLDRLRGAVRRATVSPSGAPSTYRIPGTGSSRKGAAAFLPGSGTIKHYGSTHPMT